MLTNRSLASRAALAAAGLLGLLAWRLFSPEAERSKRRPAAVHTHTVTFTCSRTCTNYAQVPEVFPWRQ